MADSIRIQIVKLLPVICAVALIVVASDSKFGGIRRYLIGKVEAKKELVKQTSDDMEKSDE